MLRILLESEGEKGENMKIDILPASRMMDVYMNCFYGRDYVVRRRYHISYGYVFSGWTPEKAKAALLAQDGLFGFNTTHADRPDGFYTPKGPDEIVIDYGMNHETRPKDRASAQCVLYFSNSPQHTALLDNFSGIRIDARKDVGGCTLVASFDADFHVTLPDSFADPMTQFKGYDSKKVPPAEEWIEKQLAYNLGFSLDGEDISYLYSVPYTYPGIEKFWPWQEREPEDVHLEIIEAVPLEEGTATCFFDEDTLKRFQNGSMESIMR